MTNINDKYKGIFAVSQALEAALVKSGMPEIESVLDNISALEQLGSIIASNDRYQSIANSVSNNAETLSKALASAVMTPELSKLENSLSKNPTVASAEYLIDFINQWNAILDNNTEETSIAAQNLAALRLDPGYVNIKNLPYGGKAVLNSLTKDAAEQLTQTDKIKFDPNERKFFHNETPENKISSDNITVVTSAIDLFEDISESDLIFFESYLMANPMMALENDVGKRIKRKVLEFEYELAEQF